MVDIPGMIQSTRQQRMKMVQSVVCKVFTVALNELKLPVCFIILYVKNYICICVFE